ncbi:MAG: PAS domain-containing protein [Anaerolineales bacterium]|nr:PAS domain-containing protein [Anaerolineales bacterium]
MSEHSWVEDFPAAITVCDPQGIIIEMNAAAIEVFRTDGGENLLGTNALDCHPQRAREILEGMLSSGQKNVYTIEKRGRKKLIYQSPWYQDGQYAGFVELSLVIPDEIPHFVRD